MRKIVVNGLLVNALFSTACSVGAGSTDTATGTVFAVLGVLVWLQAFFLDLCWDA